MNLKDETVPPVSRFGFRFHPSKTCVDKKRNEDHLDKKDPKNCSQWNASTKINSIKHLNKQPTFGTVKDASVHLERRKNTNINDLGFDQQSATSNDSNSSLKSKSVSSVSGKAPCSGITVQHMSTNFIGHALQVPIASRRSRSRDACRDLKNEDEVKEVRKFRDQSLGLFKGRSKSRECGNKQLSINKKSAGKRPTAHIEPSSEHRNKSSADVDINCNIREHFETNLVDQASLRADLSYLRRKLLELKDVLSAGNSSVSDVEITAIREENCVIKEENSQLKEKVKILESQLDLKMKQIKEMNDKFAVMKCLPISIDEGVENSRDSSVGTSRQNHLTYPPENENSNELPKRDKNDNVLCVKESPEILSHDCNLLDLSQNDTALRKIATGVRQVEQKIKRPSQLPMRSFSKKSIPKCNWKICTDQDTSSPAVMCQDKIAFGLHANEDPKRLHMPNIKSQRFVK